MRWRDLAECAGMDLSVFFAPENTREGAGVLIAERERIAVAKRICADCAVRRQCLEYAIRNRCTGIYGGTTDNERRKLGK